MANGTPTYQEMVAATGPRQPWSRKVEIELGEEVIFAIERFISEDHKGRMREEDAIVLLLKDQLTGMGLLRLGEANRSVGARKRR